MKKKFLILTVVILLSINLFSQNSETFGQFEVQMKELIDLVIDSPNDNERFNANEKLLTTMEEVLSLDKSFNYPFTSLNRISNLKSSDNKFRIFTWAIVSHDGKYENFGVLQAKNESTSEYEIYILKDKSEEIFNPEMTKTDNQTWYGAVYYELLTMDYEGRNVYTLIGYDGNDIYTKRKIIDFISFKPRSAKPIFGANNFYKDRDRTRYIFEYNPDAKFFLLWDNQYYEDKNLARKRKPIFRKRPRTSGPNIVQEYMIVYDVLEPMYEGLEGKNQFYISSGYVNGFKFERGKWRLIENVQPRNQKEEPNFNPAEKKTIPLYTPK
ncbi:MAG: hypothetical protein H6Q16_409 [Bacteroidetes bacterium]|nr:hypothetical protein [Bacteroidota bacterium]